MTDAHAVYSFETDLPVMLLTRPRDGLDVDWALFDRGPGKWEMPASSEVSLHAKNIDDDDLYRLIRSLTALKNLTYLNLAENRKITDLGLSRLPALPWITRLNLSSCSITNAGLQYVAALTRLEYLNISYCNRITDEGLRALKSLNRLAYLDLQGCVKTTHAGVKKIERRGLTIHH
jgi:hypothetical protein